jgi:hypothetical protein
MAIKILDNPEPYSRAVDLYDDQYTHVRSRAFDSLRHQLLRYVNDDLRGNSVLVSGHRGAGKTALVSGAVTSVERELRNREPPGEPGERWPKRLLLVEMHGPSLVTGGDQPPPSGMNVADQTPPPGFSSPSPAAGSTPPGVATGAGDGPAAASPAVHVTNSALWVGPPVPAAPPADQSRTVIDKLSDEERLLTYLVLYLHLTLLRAVTFGFWKTVARSSDDDRGCIRLAELAAEFTRELDDFPAPARLRVYWQRAQALDGGLLFWRQKSKFKDAARYRRDQGLKELLLVSSSVEFYRRVSGTFTQGESESEGSAEGQASKSDSELNLKNLVLPLVGLLSGGLVGGGAIALDSTGFQASLLGILTGILTAGSLKLSGTRSRDHTLTRSKKWERDLTVKTLRPEIPRLLQRFIDAGIYPIFLIDEVDKVEDISKFDHVVQQLKVLFSERVFVCFASDRKYYHRLQVDTGRGKYPKAATVFRQRLFVVYLPEDLLGYLSSLIP